MTLQTIETAIKHYAAFIKAHERLLIIGLSAFLVYHGIGAGLKTWEDHDQRIATIAAQKVQADTAANKIAQAKLDQLKKTVEQQAKELQAAMSKRALQTEKQKNVDSQMTPSELAIRFQKLLNLNPKDITTTNVPIEGSFVFSPLAAQTNVAQLEDFNKLKLDVQDLKTELDSQSKIIDAQGKLLDGTKLELADEKKSHTADVALLKVQNKKSFMRGLKIGFIAGIVTSEIVRVVLFHKP